MTVTVYEPAEPTQFHITSHRFLFVLHDAVQRVIMDAVFQAAQELLPTQITNFEPGAIDANGYPLDVLRVFRLSKMAMDALGGQVDLLSADMTQFFTAAGAVGVYGNDSSVIASEIARIQSNKAPAD